MDRFGKFLRKCRKSASLTQEAVALSLKVSAAYIHQLETGKIEPPTEKRCRQLALVLGVPFSELWSKARRERLEKWAQREGLVEVLETIPSENSLGPLSQSERALLKLIRSLDPQTLKDFNGLVVMLLRHHTRDEVQRTLEEYLRCA